MKRWGQGKVGTASHLVSSKIILTGYPSSEDHDRAEVWRRLNAKRTPQKEKLRRWKHSAKIRNRPPTLPDRPFDFRDNKS